MNNATIGDWRIKLRTNCFSKGITILLAWHHLNENFSGTHYIYIIMI